VYAVAGRWTLDPSKADQQAEGLAGIVAGVRQLPGFVRGFWSRDVADSSAQPDVDRVRHDDTATLRAAPRPEAVPRVS